MQVTYVVSVKQRDCFFSQLGLCDKVTCKSLWSTIETRLNVILDGVGFPFVSYYYRVAKFLLHSGNQN